MKKFALIGAAGYIAPRHLNAIKDTGNTLLAALDPNDSVGILDSYFPDARFFTEFERFDRYADLLRRRETPLDYVSIASPNYLHDSHIRFALRTGAHAVCEKPLVVNPWNAESLKDVEQESGCKVNTILQLRLHPSLVALREKVQNTAPDAHFDVELTYITGRGNWYFASWKGEEKKSGGIAANIGIHFFDMLIWLFGPVTGNRVDALEEGYASGELGFANATVRWFLSVMVEHLPEQARQAGQRTFRSITFNGEEVEFSQGFTDLHTVSYRQIVQGRGFGLDDALPSIRLVHSIRTAERSGRKDSSHPLLARAVAG
jgi:UDP-N-acetyl-2-amino-2-deoxyglucuronate dehydrogenase